MHRTRHWPIKLFVAKVVFIVKTEVDYKKHFQTQNKAQWLAAWGHVSASSQSLRFILNLRLYSGFITSRTVLTGWSADTEYSLGLWDHTTLSFQTKTSQVCSYKTDESTSTPVHEANISNWVVKVTCEISANSYQLRPLLRTVVQSSLTIA